MKKENTKSDRKLNRINVSKLAHDYFEIMIFEQLEEELSYMKYESLKQAYSFEQLVIAIAQARYECDDEFNFAGIYTPEEVNEIEQFVNEVKVVASQFFAKEDDAAYVSKKFEVIKKELGNPENERLELLENAVQDLILTQIGGGE